LLLKPSEQGVTHDLQTPLGAEQLRHQVPHTQPLHVPVPTVLENDQRITQGENMTKEEALRLIRLLSALESWAFSTKTTLPDYLHEDLCLAVEKLEKIVLKEKQNGN
jgi:hypothetical protein